jgi:hypothetical protein
MRLPITLAVAASMLLAAAPADAAGKVVTTYDAVFSGGGLYNRTDVYDTGSGGKLTVNEHMVFAFESAAKGLRFVNGQLEGVAHPTATLTAGGGREQTLVTPNSSQSGSCTGDTADPAGDGLIHDTNPADGTAEIEWIAYDALRLHMTCDPNVGSSTLDIDLDGDFSEVFATFQLPRDALDAGKVIQLVAVDPAAPCPGRGANTTRCTFKWEGQVEFTKTGTEIVDDAPAAQPAPNGPGVTPVVLPRITTGGSALNILEQIKAQLQPGQALLSVACSAACKGSASLYPRAKAKKASAAATKALATKAFTLKKAGRAKVAIRLSKSARRAVKRAGGARIVITTRPAAGGAAQKRTVDVRAR